jgi:Ni/Co efflux regulator RcnB
VTRLGPPPAGYEYVMVDGDLLKMAVGTRLVVDAIRAVVD